MQIDTAPSWLIAIILTAVFVASLEGGRRLHDLITRKSGTNEAGAAYIAGAAVGLLSLLLSFTLALSLDRYESRRKLVVDEANAISTVWERDRLLDQPFRGRLDALLRAYVKERRDFATTGVSAGELDAADARAEALQAQIWQETAAALRSPGATPFTTSLLQATNDMFDFPNSRHSALEDVVPAPVIWSLLAVAILAALTTGYGLAAARGPAGAGRGHRLVSIGLFVAVALTATLIFELDEPRHGLIVVPQGPMQRVAHAILNAPPSQ